MNLLEVGKILRPHGIKGGVKVEAYLDTGFKTIKNVFIGKNKEKSAITSIQPLNNGAYVLYLNTILTAEQAENYRNAVVYIDREEYPQFKNKLYLSDLVNKEIKNEKGETVGKMSGYEDYGATVILDINCGAVEYQLPYVEDYIYFDRDKDCFVVNQQTFEDLRVWK